MATWKAWCKNNLNFLNEEVSQYINDMENLEKEGNRKIKKEKNEFNNIENQKSNRSFSNRINAKIESKGDSEEK